MEWFGLEHVVMLLNVDTRQMQIEKGINANVTNICKLKCEWPQMNPH